MRIAFRFALSLLAVALLFACARVSAQAAPSSQPPQSQAQTAAPQSTSDQAYSLPPDKLAKAITLNKIRLTLEITGALWGLAVLWLLLASQTAAGLDGWARGLSRHRWIQGIVFFAAFFVITTLASLPLDAIGHIASRHYGISVQAWGGWLGDQGKALAIAVTLGSLVLLLFNWIVKRSPRRFWLWCWVITLPLMVLATLASPFFERIFDQFEPLALHHAPLVANLEKVVARTGTEIPPDRMFLMMASIKTNGLNAYVSGMGATKRIVVWDTTAGRIPDDQVMFIFGHETGHYVLHHIQKGLIAAAVFLFFVFWGCAGFSQWLVRRYGERWDIHAQDRIAPLATRAGFVVLLFTLSIAGFVLQPIGNTFSRYLEHQADVYGQEAMHGLVPDPQKTAVAAFDSLGEAWLEDPNPSRFVEFWLYNHPSVKNRANFAAHYNPWANGGHGEFFKQ
ncbi:MAG TPA: M48 family metallopeptidase [Terracidiphilus sp.]|jgi:Zn-dependent protease with chaperone function|nr:M48 family metallopeptidase [Terracidiphilus sp.]